MLEQKPDRAQDDLIKNLRETSPKSPQTSKAKPSPQRDGLGRFVRWRYLLPAVLVILVLLGLYGYFTYKTVLSHVNSGVDHIQAAVDAVKNDQAAFNLATLDNLTAQLSAAQSDFHQARDAAGPVSVVLPLVGWLPGPAYDLSQLPAFLEIAEKTSQSGVLVLQGARPALAPFDNSQSSASGSGPAGATASGKLTQAAQALALPDAQARFTQAAALLDEVAVRRAGLDPAKLQLGQTKKAVGQLDQQLPALRDGLQLARDLPPLLPAVLGTNKPVTYLTLIQNSDELRATGGFLSAVGLLTLDNGKMSLSNFSDSYAVDNPDVTPVPPPALLKYMQAGYLVLRDANWWPDFPTSAKEIANIYRLDTGTTVDNVLALDSKTVGYLFEALGPLDLPSYNEHLTADNFQERLRYYYLPPNTDTTGDWWQKRKNFIGVVMTGLLGKLNGATARDYIKVATALGQAATEKHFQLYSTNSGLESQLAKRNLNGAQTSPAVPATPSVYNDYLMMVDSNLSFSKASPNIDRTASYRVNSGGQGASLFASLTVTYTSRTGVREGTNPGECVKVAKYDSSYESMMNGCYWNYLRVYVPSGSRLNDFNGFPADDPPVTGQENGLTYFASQLVIPPGGTVAVTLNYLLPGTLPQSPDYCLTVQQQAGAMPTHLTVALNWPNTTRWWEVRLDRDLVFEQS